MRTPMHTTFDHRSSRSPELLAFVARAVSWPTRFLRTSVETLNRRREQARLQAELAALDDHLLTDIGLRRAPADRWDAVNGPCG